MGTVTADRHFVQHSLLDPHDEARDQRLSPPQAAPGRRTPPPAMPSSRRATTRPSPRLHAAPARTLFSSAGARPAPSGLFTPTPTPAEGRRPAGADTPADGLFAATTAPATDQAGPRHASAAAPDVSAAAPAAPAVAAVEPRHASAAAPAVAPADVLGPEDRIAPGESGMTLDDLVSGTWDELLATHGATCFVCGGDVAPRWSAGARPVGGRCTSCHTELS